jgi:hypothetical protein
MTSHLNDKSDLNAPTTNTASNFFRSADGSWNVLPIALGTLLVASAGYLLWNDQFSDQSTLEAPAVERTMK